MGTELVERSEKVATLALTQHYDTEDAGLKYHELSDRIRGMAMEANPEMVSDEKFEDLIAQDVVSISVQMMFEKEAWWESTDPEKRAIEQLQRDSLLMPIDDLLSDIETCLDVDLGSTKEEKVTNLQENRFRYLAELKGEEYEEPQNLLQQLATMLQNPPEQEVEVLEDKQDFDDFGAPIDGTPSNKAE